MALPNSIILDRMKSAQDIPFDLRGACGDNVFDTVDAHSKAIGTPHAFIFFPLLTVIASCMGVKAQFQVNEVWKEPSILWTVVAARKGEKKTPACKRLTKAIAKLEAEIQEELSSPNKPDDASDDENAPSKPKIIPTDKMPQLLVDYFSFEELYNLMNRSGRQILAVYDEVMVLYQQLDLYKPTGSKIDKTTLLSLFNGGSWNRNFKNSTATTHKMTSTAFNYTGFIQPKFLIDMLNRDDADGFYDRLMVVCPQEILVPFNDLQVPMPADIVDLYDVFKMVRNIHHPNHDDHITYEFEQDALDKFAELHDHLQEMKAATNNENRRGHLIKAITQLVRVSGILHVIETAFNAVKSNQQLDVTSWPTKISIENITSAWQIVQYTLRQKWALMAPESIPRDADSDESFVVKYAGKIRKLLIRNDFPMSPSNATRFRCIPSTIDASGDPVKVNAENATIYLEKLERLGFLTMRAQTGKNKRTSAVFDKRKYSELEDDTIEYLKKAKISREEYENKPKETLTQNEQPKETHTNDETEDKTHKGKVNTTGTIEEPIGDQPSTSSN